MRRRGVSRSSTTLDDSGGRQLEAAFPYPAAASPRNAISRVPQPTLRPRSFAGACGGETACSTCHVYVAPAFYAKLPEVSEAEEDMLDLAAGLKDNSRLGCQIYAAENLDGMVVEMPKEVNNMKG